ncbi:MBL fold metallo-hydrolase [Pauljensenia sp. UMB0018B]|nr:MBL fold metallo-hydrolase [Schaalia odontolytica]MDK7340414.1 MBL fold metallo-hydrolase [Pauljensenia sp. UMB0018B]
MNLRYGQLWQRLGLAVLSGILVASLAPATAAAPADGQDMHGDMESADLDTSSSDSDVSSPATVQDRAAAEETESADEATASAEEESVDGVDAQVYTFPGVDGPTRIHVLSTHSSDAILLESKGVFGMIDGGEGYGAPDGSDPRYPLRYAVIPASSGETDFVLGYMSNHGVTSSNLAFYLGTHAHSDHIDNADEIIRKFRPKVILSPEYSDAWITDESRLWDNQWVYDNMMAAARWAQGAYGASIVQNVHDYNTHITLGDMDVQILPTDPAENYKKTGVRDANLIAYTAKVSAFGRSAYLAADLEAGGGYEDRLAPIIGHVDMLKAGHHGLPTSNSVAFVKALSPSMIAQTGPEWYTPDNLTQSVIGGNSSWVPMMDLWSSAHIPALIATFGPSGISYNDLSSASWGHEYGALSPRAWWFVGGRPSATNGWWKGASGNWYYFAGRASSVVSQWVYDGGQWYWMDATGAMATGWIHDGKSWYYLDSAGHPSSSGWKWIDGAWYYLDAGRARTGWMFDRGQWYWLDSINAKMATGWTQVDGQWYYMGSSGAMATGWMSSGGTWYYLSGSGAMVTGWGRVSGSWYYFSATGAMMTGWFQDGSTSWYYAGSSGSMMTGWLNSGGAWYYLSSSGALATGWVLDSGAWYYMDDTGAMVTGTREIEGRSSTFSLSGRWIGYAS